MTLDEDEATLDDPTAEVDNQVTVARGCAGRLVAAEQAEVVVAH